MENIVKINDRFSLNVKNGIIHDSTRSNGGEGTVAVCHSKTDELFIFDSSESLPQSFREVEPKALKIMMDNLSITEYELLPAIYKTSLSIITHGEGKQYPILLIKFKNVADEAQFRLVYASGIHARDFNQVEIVHTHPTPKV